MSPATIFPRWLFLLLLLVFFILFDPSYADHLLLNDRLLIKFVDDTHVIRSKTPDGFMIVGIGSVDTLSITHGVKYYKKLARDYPESSPHAMYYRVFFHDSKDNIEQVRQDFENDSHIEIADLEYLDETEAYWEPDDFFYDFAPDAGWPCAYTDPFEEQFCNSIPTTWGEAYVELWPLHNDGNIYADEANCNYEYGRTPWASEGEDINADAAWDHYLRPQQKPPDPNGIPGDPNVLIGHMDTGVDYNNPEIRESLWYNPLEDHGDLGKFIPDLWYDLGGDKGSPTWEDGYPGLPEIDDDGDGLADYFDEAVLQIISDFEDNDNDGSADDEPGGASADCPAELVLSGALKPDGTPYTWDDIGTPGVDDDNDDYIDECDGALWDDDENGYVDDVIGWDFGSNAENGDNDPTPLTDPPGSWYTETHFHGTQTFGISAANANNDAEEDAPVNGCLDHPLLNDSFPVVRMGMVGVCPDCRIVALRGTTANRVGREAIYYGTNLGIKTFVNAAMWETPIPEVAALTFELGGIYVSGSPNWWCRVFDSHLYLEDWTYMINIAGTMPSGSCLQGAPGLYIDITMPVYPLITTRELYGLDHWYNPSVAFVGQGTSAAMQFAAGAAGLLFSYSDLNGYDWSNREVISRLIYGSKKYEDGYFPEYSREYSGPNWDLWRPVGIGRLDVHNAMTMGEPLETPLLSILQAVYDFGSGPGNQDSVTSQDETFGIHVKIFNYGGTLHAPEWILTSDDPYVTILDGVVYPPDIPSWDSVSNADYPFEVKISADAPPGHVIFFDLEIDGSNAPPWVAENQIRCVVSLKEIYSIEDYPYSNYPVMGELDGDHFVEIVLASRDYVKAINAEDGTELWQNTGYQTSYDYMASSLGDVNGDAQNEVIFRGRNSSYARVLVVLDGNTGGPISNEIPYVGSDYKQPPVLADWDNDGDLEIIVGDDFSVLVFNFDNGQLSVIRSFTISSRVKAVSVADLNGDNKTDIVVVCRDTPGLNIIDNSGSILFSGGGGSYGPASIADVDNDSQLEILYLEESFGLGLAWLAEYDVGGYWYLTDIIIDPDVDFRKKNSSIGDWNNDELLEMFFYATDVETPHDGKILVYNYDGQGSYGNSYSNPRFEGDSFLKYGDILVADLNSDGLSDILIRGNPEERKILGLSGLGTGIGIWGEEDPLVFIGDYTAQYAVPIIGDMNSDGIINIYSNPILEIEHQYVEGKLELYDTGGQNYEGALQWPQYRHDARRTSLYAQPVGNLIVDQDMTIWDDMVVWGAIDVQAGATLTIKPGVHIKFKPDKAIDVHGTLNALGTASEPIIFSGTDQSPTVYWKGIQVHSSASVNLKHCWIDKGVFGVISLTGILGASIDIDSSFIKNAFSAGILGDYCDLTVTATEISESPWGIDIGKGRLHAEGNTFINTFIYGIRIAASPGLYPDSSRILKNEIYQSPPIWIGSIGIFSHYTDKLGIRENHIYNYDQAGIKVQHGSPEITDNKIHNIIINGMLFYSNANSQTVKRNHVWDVSWGVFCGVNSYPILGLNMGVPTWGNNSFHDTGGDPVVNNNFSPSPPVPPVYAQRNWWGEPRCPHFSTNVICEPPLDRDPFGKVVVEQPELPNEFALHQNYPNPFNSTSIIRFDLPEASWVTIKIYNILGQQVVKLTDNGFPAGYHSVMWNGRNNSGDAVASGIYLYTISAGDFRSSRKMTILK